MVREGLYGSNIFGRLWGVWTVRGGVVSYIYVAVIVTVTVLVFFSAFQQGV